MGSNLCLRTMRRSKYETPVLLENCISISSRPDLESLEVVWVAVTVVVLEEVSV